MTVFFWRGRDNYGIDFSSGTSLHLRLQGLGRQARRGASRGANSSAFTVAFFERAATGPNAPADASDAIVREATRPR